MTRSLTIPHAPTAVSITTMGAHRTVNIIIAWSAQIVVEDQVINDENSVQLRDSQDISIIERNFQFIRQISRCCVTNVLPV
jgi:hypothetical protein